MRRQNYFTDPSGRCGIRLVLTEKSRLRAHARDGTARSRLRPSTTFYDRIAGCRAVAAARASRRPQYDEAAAGHRPCGEAIGSIVRSSPHDHDLRTPINAVMASRISGTNRVGAEQSPSRQIKRPASPDGGSNSAGPLQIEVATDGGTRPSTPANLRRSWPTCGRAGDPRSAPSRSTWPHLPPPWKAMPRADQI